MEIYKLYAYIFRFKLLSSASVLLFLNLTFLLILSSCNPANTSADSRFRPGISISASNSTLTASANSVATNELVRLTLTLRDTKNQLFIANDPDVYLYAEGGTSTGTLSSLSNNGDGTYSGTFRGLVAGTAKTIHAMVDGKELTSTLPQIAVSAGFYDLNLSSVTLSSSTLASGSTQTVTLTVRDDLGNVLPTGGLAITFAAVGGGSTVSFSSVTDNLNGTYTSVVMGLAGGTPTTIRGYISGNLLTSTLPSLTVTGGSPASIAVSSGGSQTGVVGSTLTSPFVAIVRDSNNNPLSGVTVDWLVSLGNGSLSVASSVSDSGGLASSTMTLGTLTGVNTAIATVQGSAISTSFSATASSLGASSLSFNTNPSASGNTDTALSSQPVISARDTYGNVATNYTGSITLTAYSSTSCTGVVTGGLSASTNPVTAVSGVASFAGLRILKTSVQSVGASDGVRVVCYGAMTISPGVVSSLSFTTAPSSVNTASAAFGTQPVITLYDANSNVVTTSSANVVMSLFSGTGTLSGTTTIAAVSGVASFTNLSINLSGSKVIRATVGGVTQNSTSFTVNAGVASTLAVTQSPSSSGNTDSALSTQPIIEARDASGNVVTGYNSSISFSGYSDSSCTTPVASGLTGQSATSVSGVATWSALKVLKTNVVAIRATDGSLSTSCLSSLSIAPGAVNSLSFTTDPSSVNTASAAFGTQPVITLYDANSNVVTTSSANVVMSLFSGTGTLSGTTTIAAVSGVASFTNLSINLSGSKVIRATVGGVTQNSSSFIVNSGSAASLAVTQSPSSSGSTDSALGTQPIIEARDGLGNVVAAYNNTISFTAYSDSSCSTVVALALSGNSVVASSGVATWSALRILKTNVVAIKATDGSVSSSCLSSLSIAPGAVNSLSFTTDPSSVNTASAAFGTQPVITLYDANSNVVTTSSANVVMSLFSGTGTLSGTTTIAAVSGVASFTNLSINLSGSKVIRATVGGVTQNSTSFTVNAGVASTLAVTQSPSSSGNTDSALSTQPIIEARDASGNVVTGYNSSISFSGYSDSSCTTPVASGLTGQSATSVSGVATWSALKVLKTNVVAIRATDGSLSTSCLSSLSITAGAVNSIAFTTQPSLTNIAGATFGTQPVITLYDSNSNVVTSSSASVVLSLSTGTGSLSGTTTIAAVNGVASFTNLSVNLTGTNKVLTATVGSVTATSNTFSITPGAFSLAQSTISSSASTLSSGSSVVITLTAKDSYGNSSPTGITSVTFDSTVVGGTGSFGATTNAGSGVYTSNFTGSLSGSVTLSGLINLSTISATSVVTVNAGSVSQLAFTTSPSTSSNTDTALSTQPVVTAQDAVGNTVPSFVSSITLSAYSDTICSAAVTGGVSTSGNPLSAVSGVASFAGIKLLKTSVQSIAASDGTRSVCFGTFVISAGAASAIAVSSGNNPTQTAYRGTVLGSPFVAVVRDANANIVSGATVNWAVITGGGSLSSSSNTTNGSGLSSSTLTVGTPGSNTVTATIDGTATAVTFTATSTTIGFTQNYPFDSSTASSYTFDNLLVEFTGGVTRLLGTDQVDDDGTSSGFVGGTGSSSVGVAAYGTLTGEPASNGIKLGNNGSCNGASAACANASVPELYELNSSWTPRWANLVSYWKMNESAGATSISDSKGTNTGTVSNSPTFGVSGQVGTGVQLNQSVSNQVITLGNSLLTGTGDFTLSAWIYPTSLTNSNYIMGSYATGNTGGIQFYTLNANLTLFIGSSITLSGMVLNQWQHVVAVRSSGNVTLYRNGIGGTATALAGSIVGNTNWTIGNASNFTSERFRGSIDEAAVWSVALTASEVATLYARQSVAYSGVYTSRIMDAYQTGQSWTSLAWSTTLPFMKALPDYASSAVQNESSTDYSSLITNSLMTDIVGLWHLDETAATAGSENDLLDTSGNGNHGEQSGTITFGSGGRLNNSIRTDGTSSYVQVKQNSGLPITGQTAFTISAWVMGDSQGDRKFFVETSSVVDNAQYALGTSTIAGSKKLRLQAISDSGTTLTSGYSTLDVFDNTWRHIVLIDNAGTVSLYIDGVLDGTNFNYTRGTLGANRTSFGARRGRFSTNGYFLGLVDEIALWKRALSLNEVKQLYQRGASRIKFQARTCDAGDPTCAAATWKGPDGSANTFFSELFNMSTQAATPSGTVNKAPASMNLQNYTSPVAANRFFQYRAILESDSATAALQPELKTVTVGPSHFSSSAPTVVSKTGVSFYSLSSFLETLRGSCSSGIGYNLGVGTTSDSATWYWWDSTANSNAGGWVTADGTVSKSNAASVITTNAGTFGTQVGTGTVYFKAYLKSTGGTACELDNIQFNGQN